VHLLNLWRLPDGPCVWQKCRWATLGDDAWIVVKGVHRSGSRGYVNLVATRAHTQPQMQHDSVPFLGLRAAELAEMAGRAGAGEVLLFGGYEEEAYVADASTDLIMTAEK
jgi:hypothetical protein